MGIKWDIDDVTKLYVFDEEGRKICEAVSPELLAFGPHCSQAVLEKLLRDQRRQEREMREILDSMTRPYELRGDGKAVPDFSEARFIFVGANDPSLGKNRKSDTSAIIGIAKDTSSGYLYVVIADIAKRKPDKIIDDALDDSRRLRREYKKPFYKFGVEAVQFQYYFAEIMRQRAAECGEYLPIEEINSVQNKDARIQSLQPFVKNGYLKFSKKHKTLIDQLLKYPMGKNDDAPDALQMAVALALSVKVGRKVDYKSVQGRAIRFRRGAY